VYGAYLTFQLWSHAHLYDDKNNPDISESKRYPPRAKKVKAEAAAHSMTGAETVQSPTTEDTPSAENGTTLNDHADPEASPETEEEEEEEEKPQMTIWMAIILLAIITVVGASLFSRSSIHLRSV
jgi:Ca2+:H+ antiporter